MIFSSSIILIILIIIIINNKYKKNNILWPISILKHFLPFLSITFFGQIFFLFITIFDCNEGHLYVSVNFKCNSGLWFSFIQPTTYIAIFFHFIIALITHILYCNPVFNHNKSDVLKKNNSIPDIVFLFIKIFINLIF